MEDLNKILLDFVDGVADDKQQKELFSKLSVDEELQHKMQNLMKIENAVKDRSNAFTPPASSTIKVFDALGFKASKVSLSDKVVAFLGKYTQAGVASLITALLFTSGFLIFNNDNSQPIIKELVNDNREALTIVMNEEPIKINENSNNRLNILVANKPNSSDEKALNNIAPVMESKRDFVDEENSFSDKGFTETPKVIRNENINDQRSIIEYLNVPAVNNTITQVFFDDQQQNYFNKNNNRFSFEINAEPMIALNSNIDPSQTSSFDNLGISALYDLNNNWFLGASVKQETYFQRFSEIDTYNRKVVYEQRPNFTVVEAFARYDLMSSYGYPIIAQLGLGFDAANFSGLTIRSKIGLKQDIGDNIYFLLGPEFSNLTYTFNGNIHTSQNVGVFIGLGIK